MTDSVWGHEDYVGCVNFDNWIIQTDHYPRGYGWIHRDGTVGTDGITQCYPTVDKIVREWFQKLTAFPYLDLVIGITGWNEMPRKMREWQSGIFEELREWQGKGDVFLEKLGALMKENRNTAEEFDREFFKAIEYGVYVHDKKIELLNPEDTIEKYKEYSALYGEPREKYLPEYYDRSGIVQADPSFVRKCAAAYGPGAEKELSQISEKLWYPRTQQKPAGKTAPD
ncbi:MAG TPA: hypothetical protein IAB31_05795 [Candidatus Choladousia intestinavium]|uniref:Uncharacterized protein n=1 Tax=Candidatus Choladousia intestinavium TaxID=2840727 RepID=A0A9D1ADH9_9FIRM|nr:hypothetical protein [Candidatus Choladousia intestinavium]